MPIVECTAVEFNRYCPIEHCEDEARETKTAPKLIMTLRDIETGEIYACYLNVSVVRERNSKYGQKGEPYKDQKQFIPGRNGTAWKLFKQAGLSTRHGSRTDFWECCGQFVGVLFVVESLPPVKVIRGTDLNVYRLTTGYRPVKHRLTTGYQNQNLPVKESLQPAKQPGLQPDSTRGVIQLGKEDIEKIREKDIHPDSKVLHRAKVGICPRCDGEGCRHCESQMIH